MGRTNVTALVAATAAGAGVLAVGAGSLLRRQAAVARRRIGKPHGEDALDADRVWRRRHTGEPVELVILGDSIAAGLGADHRKETLGARLAKGVARATHRPVRLRTAAVVGSESAALAGQLDALPDDLRPDVAVIVVGGNDVTHRVPVTDAAASLEHAIGRLRARGAAVVVGTCPDLGALRPVPQPLRSLGSRMSRQLAAAQAEVGERAGALVVPLGRVLGPFFSAEPDEMFSLDRFHPSALGYRRTAEALLPAVLRALEPAADHLDPTRPAGNAESMAQTPDPTPKAWQRLDAYLADTLVGADAALDGAVARQRAAGLPAIEVARVSGKLLHLLVRISGARRVLEIGTLGAYSTIWLARALPEDGRVVTVEAEPANAAVARDNLDRAGVGDRVEIRVGRGEHVLPTLQGTFDLVFIDADKESNALYLDWAARLGHPGTVVVVDNIGRAGEAANPASDDPKVVGTRAALELLGTDPRFDATALQTLDAKGWDGVAIAVLTDVAGTPEDAIDP